MDSSMIEGRNTCVSSDPAVPPPLRLSALPANMRVRRDPGPIKHCLGLIQDLAPKNVNPIGLNSVLGLGFGNGGIPIDIATLLLAGAPSGRQLVLIVDEFQRLNGESEASIDANSKATEQMVLNMAKLFKLEIELLKASTIMASSAYKGSFEMLELEIECHPKKDAIQDLLQLTVPPSKVCVDRTGLYAKHEIAITRHLIELEAIDLKVGPSREQVYDRIMRELGMGVAFAYVRDALPVGTDKPEPVVHYIPKHRGQHNGQRILLDEPRRKILAKLECCSEETARYLLALALAAGERLGMVPPPKIESAFGRTIRKIARDLIMQNVIDPLSRL